MRLSEARAYYIHTVETYSFVIAMIFLLFLIKKKKKKGRRVGEQTTRNVQLNFFSREQPCNLMRFIQYLRSKLIFSQARS